MTNIIRLLVFYCKLAIDGFYLPSGWGQAWQETSRRLRETVVRSFVKCGIALQTSGSKDSEINIDGLSDYSIGESANVEELTFYSVSDDDIFD